MYYKLNAKIQKTRILILLLFEDSIHLFVLHKNFYCHELQSSTKCNYTGATELSFPTVYDAKSFWRHIVYNYVNFNTGLNRCTMYVDTLKRQFQN